MKSYIKGTENSQVQLKKLRKGPNLLKLATVYLGEVYAQCNPKFKSYNKIPKRILTQPKERVSANVNDNINFDYIFCVHDVLSNPKKNTQYYVSDLLGKGTFGQVLLCQNQANIKLAVKVVKSRPAYLNQGLIQAKILRQLSKINKFPYAENAFVKIYDAFMWNSHLCIVEQVMESSLLDIIRESNYEGIGLHWIEKWIKPLLLSLCYIHQLGIIHCDIKPENIMFRQNDSDRPILIDFSSSCYFNQQIYTYIQSRFYRAPQILLGVKPYSSKIDVWSLGCVLIQLYIGLPIFPGSSSFDQISKIVKLLGFPSKEQLLASQFGANYFEIGQKVRLYAESEYSQIHSQVIIQSKNYFKIKSLDELIADREIQDLQLHQLFIDFLKKIMVIDPNMRISAQQAYIHPFVGGTQFEIERMKETIQILKEGISNTGQIK